MPTMCSMLILFIQKSCFCLKICIFTVINNNNKIVIHIIHKFSTLYFPFFL